MHERHTSRPSIRTENLKIVKLGSQSNPARIKSKMSKAPGTHKVEAAIFFEGTQAIKHAV